MNEGFRVVGRRPMPAPAPAKKAAPKGRAAMIFLILLAAGCLIARFWTPKDPAYMDLANANKAPCGEFLFGTDTMGRDIFSMIFYGGGISLTIGLMSTAISTVLAMVLGTLSGFAPNWLDRLLMRLTEVFLSIPELLLVILLQAVLGKATPWSISLVLGLTGWTGIAKVVRTEVRRLRQSGYIVASRCMGGGFFRLLFGHLAPNFFSSILFMVVMNIRSAMVAESTLSFMGLGLPLETISWGSMLSLAEKALLTGSWWIILIPGAFLAVTLLSVTDLAHNFQTASARGQRNL